MKACLKFNLLRRALPLAVFFPILLTSVSFAGNAPPAGELYGGIEVGSKGVKATAIRVSPGVEGYNVKLIYAEVINTTLMQLKENKFAPEVIKETVEAIQKLIARMKSGYGLSDDRISIIGSSGLRADNPDDLIQAVKEKTGKEMEFLDVESEVQLSIVGTIPQRVRTRSGWIDNRGASMLIDIGSGNTKGGYQTLRQTTNRSPEYDYVTVGIPKGTVSFTNEIAKAAGETSDLTQFAQKAKELAPTSIQAALRREMERKPGLTNRRRVYLSGGIVWAAVTLMRPDDRRPYVPLTVKDIDRFHKLATDNPQDLQALLTANLAKRITNPVLRKEVEKELESVRNSFTPRNLVAGAEILKAIATEFNLSGKRIRFARYGYLSWILSYVRLTAL
jgi:hypothetical protein